MRGGWRRCWRAGGPRRLLHVYGPTESTTFATWHLVTTADAGAATIPIGRPIANTTAYVLDAQGAPAPIGVAGRAVARRRRTGARLSRTVRS